MFNSLASRKLYTEKELINLYEKTEMHMKKNLDKKIISIKKRENPSRDLNKLTVLFSGVKIVYRVYSQGCFNPIIDNL